MWVNAQQIVQPLPRDPDAHSTRCGAVQQKRMGQRVKQCVGGQFCVDRDSRYRSGASRLAAGAGPRALPLAGGGWVLRQQQGRGFFLALGRSMMLNMALSFVK